MKLREGMVIAIEPMVNAGKPGVQVLSDGWTAVTEDGSMSAHFEHTVAVTADAAQLSLTVMSIMLEPTPAAQTAGSGRIRISDCRRKTRLK